MQRQDYEFSRCNPMHEIFDDTHFALNMPFDQLSRTSFGEHNVLELKQLCCDLDNEDVSSTTSALDCETHEYIKEAVLCNVSMQFHMGSQCVHVGKGTVNCSRKPMHHHEQPQILAR